MASANINQASAKARLAAILAKRKTEKENEDGKSNSNRNSNQSSKSIQHQDVHRLGQSTTAGNNNGASLDSKSGLLDSGIANSIEDSFRMGELEATQSSSPSGIPTPQSVVSTTNPLADKLKELENALHKRLPDTPYLLKHIFDALREDSETVTLFTPEEIGLVTAGMIQHTQTTIVAAPKKSTKKTQPLTLDALD